MLLDKRDELYRSSILKLLIWFAVGLFLMMALLLYQLYSTSLHLYNQNLDDWLQGETSQLQSIANSEGIEGVQQSIDNNKDSNRYIYQFVNHAFPIPTNTSSTSYPVIAQIKQYQANNDLPNMRATRIELPDGDRKSVV